MTLRDRILARLRGTPLPDDDRKPGKRWYARALEQLTSSGEAMPTPEELDATARDLAEAVSHNRRARRSRRSRAQVLRSYSRELPASFDAKRAGDRMRRLQSDVAALDRKVAKDRAAAARAARRAQRPGRQRAEAYEQAFTAYLTAKRRVELALQAAVEAEDWHAVEEGSRMLVSVQQQWDAWLADFHATSAEQRAVS